MSISTAIADTMKTLAVNVIAPDGHVIKAALIKAGAVGSYGRTTAGYGDLGADECAASGGYPTGGITLTWNKGVTGGVGWVDAENATIATFVGSADGLLVYDDSDAGKRVMSVHYFGATKTASGGNFDLTIPSSGLGFITF